MTDDPAANDAVAAAHAAFLRTKHLGGLDGLRAISIVTVVWHHVVFRAGIEATGGPGLLARVGHYGVALFFAISGLLITTLLLRERSRTGTISLTGFYARRTLRIFPLYYAVLALYVVLVATLEAGTPAGARFFENLPAYVTYTSNWFVERDTANRVIFYFAWSLATEEQFYFVWPWVVRFARRWYQPILFMLVMLVAGQSVRWALHAGALPRDPLVVRVLASIASPICLGSIAACLLHHPAGFRAIHRIAGARWSAPLAATVLVLTVGFERTPELLLALVMAWLVVSCAIVPANGLTWLLDHPAVRHVGVVSYGMYLLHLLAINVVRRWIVPHGSELLTFAVALPLAIAAASVTYRFFEVPVQRLRDRRRGPDAVAAAAGAPQLVPAAPVTASGPPASAIPPAGADAPAPPAPATPRIPG